MQLLLEHKDEIQKKDYTPWINYAKEMKAKYPIVTEEARTQKELVNTYALLDTITEQMTADDIYVSGSSGTCIDVSMQTFRVKKGQRVFCTKGLASMGFGVPATIGACLAGDRRRTVCVNGDGGFQMNIQELETIHRLNLPIKIFVLNNQGYAQIHGWLLFSKLSLVGRHSKKRVATTFPSSSLRLGRASNCFATLDHVEDLF